MSHAGQKKFAIQRCVTGAMDDGLSYQRGLSAPAAGGDGDRGGGGGRLLVVMNQKVDVSSWTKNFAILEMSRMPRHR